jgi:hypothetical protein
MPVKRAKESLEMESSERPGEIKIDVSSLRRVQD